MDKSHSSSAALLMLWQRELIKTRGRSVARAKPLTYTSLAHKLSSAKLNESVWIYWRINYTLLVVSFKKNEKCSVILLFRCGAYEMRIEIKKPKALSLNDCWLLKYLRAQILMRLEYAYSSEWSSNLNFWTIKLERFETKPFHFNLNFFSSKCNIFIASLLATWQLWWRWGTFLIIKSMHLAFERFKCLIPKGAFFEVTWKQLILERFLALNVVVEKM